MAKIKKTVRHTEERGEIRTLRHWCWESKMVQLLWKTVWWFPHSETQGCHVTQQFHSWGRTQEKREHMSTQKVVTGMFTAASFTTVKCSSTDEWINEMWRIPKMECYSVIKRSKALTYATTGMNLRNIMLRSPLQNTVYCMIPCVWNVQNRQIYRDRKYILWFSRAVVGVGEEEGRRVNIIGYGFGGEIIKMSQNWFRWCAKTTEPYTLNHVI